MENLKVLTIRSHSYHGRRLPGDKYYMDSLKHVKLFVALKKVRLVDEAAERAACKDKEDQLAKRRARDAERRAEARKKAKSSAEKYERKVIARAPLNKDVKASRDDTKKD